MSANMSLIAPPLRTIIGVWTPKSDASHLANATIIKVHMEKEDSLPVGVFPPPYTPGEYMPEEFGSEEEPLTLARMLFQYGFVFFPFWLVGIYILFSPLKMTEDWESGKTEDEKVYQYMVIRRTELKWARRCLLATYGLLAIAFALFVTLKFGAFPLF
ncbi:hypothetical protein M422DRAFT_33825 [Sphaerobolus stellatus SS14]|uniref:Uncharacterized protein n=1 Tax=Sphaerobolus stellatus (strain SS14) TaxID=990650 RepID=A0A0C9VIY2_SPHS4|nr:hypothetical protein M422DRAFT_33825 [Sphaerobolus stellatus SS14]